MKFIHAADLHIDSPLDGLSRYDGAPIERVRLATRQAFTKVIDLALRERVRFVVLAGDLFDTGWKDYNTGLFFLREVARLREIGAEVVLVRGNHDFDLTRTLTWPDFVHQLSDKGGRVVREKDGVVFHGASYADKRVETSLLPKYGAPLADLFNVGVLHTNATGDSAHKNYAPCRVSDLVDKGYGYWALGHVHQRQVLARVDASPESAPLVVYPGNTQGRSVKELGARGVYVVEVDEKRLRTLNATFHETDVMRWHHLELRLRADDDEDDLLDRAREELGQLAARENGRMAAVRLTVSGATKAHHAVVHRREKLVAELRGVALLHGDALWLEKVKLATLPAAGMDNLAESKGLVGDLLALGERVREDESELASLAKVFDQLRAKLKGELNEVELDTQDPEWLRGIVAEAEARLAEELSTPREEPTATKRGRR